MFFRKQCIIVEHFSGFISLLLVPESPYFLMSKYNDEKSARKSLNWLYNGNDEEIEKVITDIREYQTKKIPKQSSNEKKLEITEKSILDEKTKSDEELIKVSTRISSKKTIIILF